MSILVHPDKNPDDPERSQVAFEGKTVVDLPPSIFSCPPFPVMLGSDSNTTTQLRG